MAEQRKHRRGRRKKKEKTVGDIISNVLLVVAIAVFLFSAYKLYSIFSEYNKGESEYETIQNAVITQEITEVNSGDGEEETKEEQKQETIFRVDFTKLKEMNPEAVAWIRFDKPSQISYPVVQGTDNAKYLTTTFEGKRNSAGTLFVDVQNAGDFTDKNTFVYGHNMKNGAMFGRLREYKKASFCEENPYFYIYTPDGIENKYQVFAACVVEDVSDSYNKWYETKEEYQQYIDYIRSISLYDTNVDVTTDSKIVSLSTCTNVRDEERLLVHGVKVSEKVIGE